MSDGFAELRHDLLKWIDDLRSDRDRTNALLAGLMERQDEQRAALDRLADVIEGAAIGRRLDLLTEAVFTQQPELARLRDAVTRLDARLTLLEVPPPDLIPDDESNGSGGHA